MKLPRIAITDGSAAALKWLGLVLMAGDHVNKYLLNATQPILFAGGRLALPLFLFVLAHNLARPGALEAGAYRRTMVRLGIFGLAATPAFMALGGLVGGWWPLNVMFTLLVVTAALYLVDSGGRWNLAAAAAVFVLGGSSVEFWWPALLFALAVWLYCRKPTLPALLLAVTAAACLWFINGNHWAFAAFPVIAAACLYNVPSPRMRWAFYAFYPLHLSAIWLARIPMGNAGYLFFT